ncbi:hypothetical protein, partial [Parendozoicomonas haliclonae]|uniref:hypothetical protein n=1 Tax=Parendozoicomonas haliclonae TaxID=1960125 RepID=UPI001A98FE63
MLGVVFANQEQFGKALEYFRAALKDDALHRPSARPGNIPEPCPTSVYYEELRAHDTARTLLWCLQLENNIDVPYAHVLYVHWLQYYTNP